MECGSGFIVLWSDGDDDMVCLDCELSEFRRITDALLVVRFDTKTVVECKFSGDSQELETAEGATGYCGAISGSSHLPTTKHNNSPSKHPNPPMEKV